MDLIDIVLNSPIIQIIISITKIVAPVLFLSVLGIIIYAMLGAPYVKWTIGMDILEILSQKAYGSGKVEKKWQSILKRLGVSNPAEWKLAVIEAESLIDEVLMRMGFGGDTFGERLKKITADQLASIDKLQEAHQVRNNIVHDPDYRIDIETATKTIEAYETGLRELEAL